MSTPQYLIGKGTHATRFLFLLAFFLSTALVEPLLTSKAFAQTPETLAVIIVRAHSTEAKKQESYTATVRNGTGPYNYFWVVYGLNGKAIPGAELDGVGRYVPDFDFTTPSVPGKYRIKLFVKDSKKEHGSDELIVTVNKSGGPSGPSVSDLAPIIIGPDYVEAGEEYKITWDAQKSGIGKVEWEWITPRGVLKNKGLKGKIAQGGNDITVTLLVWDDVIPKSKAIRQTHTVRAVDPLSVIVNGSGTTRLSAREFQMEKGKPFTLTASPRGGVKNYTVQWGGRAEGSTYAGTINRVGVGRINLSVRDGGRYKTTPKTWQITIRVADKTPPQSSDIAGWWLYLRDGKATEKVPVILNPRGSDGHYTGAYFPAMTVKSLKLGVTVVSNLQVYPRGAKTFYYTYKYNNGVDRGDGTMSLQGDRMSGPWNSTVGNGSGSWTWVRPNAAELQKLRDHFKRG